MVTPPTGSSRREFLTGACALAPVLVAGCSSESPFVRIESYEFQTRDGPGGETVEALRLSYDLADEEKRRRLTGFRVVYPGDRAYPAFVPLGVYEGLQSDRFIAWRDGEVDRLVVVDCTQDNSRCGLTIIHRTTTPIPEGQYTVEAYHTPTGDATDDDADAELLGSGSVDVTRE